MITTSPFLEAINKKDFTKAKELLEAGDSFPADVSEWPLRQAYETMIRGKAFSLLDILLKRKKIDTDVYELDTFRYSIYELLFKNLPLDEESMNYLRDFVKQADNINDEVEGKTLLSYAIELFADPKIIQALIDAGLQTDFKNNAEDNLISQSVRLNMIPEDRQKAYIEIFLKEGVDANEMNVEKQNSLHIAVTRDKKHLLDLLLDNGARPNEQDWKGNSAFYYALAHKMDGEVYKKMAAKEAPDFVQRNNEGQTILSEYLRMMQGSDAELELLQHLITDGASLDETAPYYDESKSGWDWIAQRSPETLQALLQQTGRDVNTQDDKGNTFLHKICAVDCNYSHEAAKQVYKKVKMLLEMGADASITNAKDETALLLATKDNLKTKTVDLLLKEKK